MDSLKQNIERLKPPGFSLTVFVNPCYDEIKEHVNPNGLLTTVVCGWRTTSIARTLKQKFKFISKDFTLCKRYWKTLVIIRKDPLGRASISIYGTSFN